MPPSAAAAAAPACWEARKLLHWVNSLPPPACLLVGELHELRFGDVLLAVTRCVGGGDSIAAREGEIAETGDARRLALARLQRVLCFVAAEARSEDRDALFVVNEAQCAERLWRGDADALCAVLRVLRRVGGARERAERKREEEKEEEARALASRQVAAALRALRASGELAAPETSGERSSGAARCRPGSELSERRAMKAATSESKRMSEAKRQHRLNNRRRTAIGLKNQVMLWPKTAKSRHCDAESFRERKVPMRHDDRGQLRVYSMIDPLTHKRADVRKPTATTSSRSCAADPNDAARSAETASRVRDWMASLGIVLPKDRFSPRQTAQSLMSLTRSVRREFADGIMLCRLAAGIVTKYGSDEDKERLHTYANASVSMPHGGTLHPQSVVEKRNNIVVASGIIARFCGRRGGKSNCEELCAKLVLFFTRQNSSRDSSSVWELLDHIRAEIEGSTTPDTDSVPMRRGGEEHSRLGADGVNVGTRENHVGGENSNAAGNTMSEIVSMSCEKRRSHITNEQMQCVDRWLASIGNDILENHGLGLLDNPFRNGVLLCNTYNRAFLLPCKPPLRYIKAPRTLLEVRQNFAKAFESLGSLKKFQMPSCYMAPSSWEAMIMGNRQVTYGFLWRLWQFAEELENQSRKAEDRPPADASKQQPSEQILESRDSSPIDPPPHHTGTKRNFKSALREKTKASSKVCPLLIDIPAAVLVRGNETISANCSAGTGFNACDSAVRMASMDGVWRCELPFEDDLHPQPSRAIDVPMSRVHVPKVAFQVNLDPNLTAKGKDPGSEVLPSTSVDSNEPATTSTRCVPETGVIPLVSKDRLEEVVASQTLQQQVKQSEIPKTSSEVTSLSLDELKAEGVTSKSDTGTKVIEDRPVIQTEVSEDVAREILGWLGHLKIRLSDPAAFLTPSAPLMEFRSGVVLCGIVEKVEYMRCIPGVCTKPNLSKANALHNISKALDILQHKKTMPLRLLRRRSEIYSGNRSVILQLLNQVRKAYGYHHHSSIQTSKAKKSRTKPSKSADKGAACP